MSAPAAAPSPVATQVVAVVSGEPLSGAEGIKTIVSQRSHAAGGVVQTLDDIALRVGGTRISLWDTLVGLMVIVIAVSVAYFTSKLANGLIARARHLDVTQRLLLQKISTLLIWTIAIFAGIDVLGINLTALTVFSGAFGLAIGFGLQKTFGNLIAGMILLLDRSIKPGDVIAIADHAGTSTFGQIRKIGIRAVSLTTRDQREYLIPNENLMINQVENWSYSSKTVRMSVPVGISYNADMRRAEELMLEAARASDRVLASPAPTVWMDSYGDSAVNFLIQCWIEDPEEGIGNIRSQVLKKLWWLLKENGIEIPFPQRDLNLRDGETIRALIEAIKDMPSEE